MDLSFEPGRVDNTLAGDGEMGHLMRTWDWSATPLGGVSSWPQSLRTAVSLCLASPLPMSIFWGHDFLQFYNDAYRLILGPYKHPSALGQRAEETWSDRWDQLGPLLKNIFRTGETTWTEHHFSASEQADFTRIPSLPCAYSPVRDETGNVGGVLCTFPYGLQEANTQQFKHTKQHRTESNQSLTALFEAIPDSVVQYDREGYPVHFNQAARTAGPLEQLTLSLSQMQRLLDLRTVEGQTLTKDELPLVLALQGQTIRGQELRYRHLVSGQDHIVSVSAAPIWNSDGSEIEGAITVTRDLSPLYQAVREATTRAHELEVLFEAMTDAVNVYDTEGHIVQANQSAKQLLQRYLPTAEAMASVTLRQELLSQRQKGQTIPEQTLPVTRLLQGETLVGAQSQDIVVATAEGDQRLFNVAGAPLRDEHGHQIGAVAVTRDLTEQRRLEQRTYQALEALLAMAQVMVQGPEPATTAAPIAKTRQIAQRIAELTRDVLGCERLSLHQVEPGTERLLPLAVVGLTAEEEPGWWASQEQSNSSLADSPDQEMIARLRRQEVVVLDLTQPPYNEQPNPYGVTSMLVAPLHLNSQLLGLLELDYSGQEHTYTEQEIALTQAACRFIALVLEREELRSTNQRLNDLIELAHDAVIVRDPQNHVQLWNQGAEQLYGWTKQEALGKVTHTLLKTHFPLSLEATNEELADAGRWEGILVHTRRDGNEVVVESRQVLVRDAADKVLAILEINRDITERERLTHERAEAQANERALREANRLMDEFIGIAGHELRTPLTTIKASTQLARRQVGRLLKQEELPAAALQQLSLIRGHLERTERQIAMQNRLVSDLLDVSRIQAGRMELNLTVHDLVALVREVIEDQQYLTPERTLTLQIDASGPVLVLADADRVRQVISNYLSNALKYSEASRPVDVRVAVNGTQARVSVRDEGPGLSPEQQQLIWERFYRVPGVEVKTGSGVGLGLGLHISRMIVELQHGQVGVQSTPDDGSTFWFTLPLADHSSSETTEH